MFARRMVTTIAISGMIGLAACADEGAEETDILMEDTLIQPDVEQVEIAVPTTDTAVVQTEIAVDTAIDVDTIDDPM